MDTLLKIPITDVNNIEKKWINFSELKNYCESIILNRTPTNQDNITLDAFRAWIQLRNDKQIDTGGGQNPGCYLNELSDGAYGYKATELSVAVNHEGKYGFWGNDGFSMGYLRSVFVLRASRGLFSKGKRTNGSRRFISRTQFRR